MVKTSLHLPNAATPVDVAAAKVLELINSKPQTPRQDEIAVIVAAALPIALNLAEAKRRAEWTSAVAAVDSANAKIRELGGDDEAMTAAEAEASAADDRLDACATRIFNERVRSFGDIALLAEVCFRVLWDANLTDPSADVRMAAGPEHDLWSADVCLGALTPSSRGSAISPCGAHRHRARPCGECDERRDEAEDKP
jgi:hypothetical protein